MLPELVFITNKHLKEGGNEVILLTRPPYFVARAFKFHSLDEMQSFSSKKFLPITCESVPGYNILICYAGTISKVSQTANWKNEYPALTKQFLKSVISFYEKERIEGNESRQKKYAR